MNTKAHILALIVLFGYANSAGGVSGLIGGEDLANPAYAALVAPDGTLTQLLGGGFPSTNGTINSVAINSAGIGLIGGNDLTGTEPAYAALVATDGTLTQLSGGGLPTTGEIFSVAINSAGVGLIGGSIAGPGPAYAALVASDGTLTQLSGGGLPAAGEIVSVAINNSGVGLIGGDSFAGSAYAALVASDGTLTQLSGGGFPANGEISSVAINNAGVGLIGGQNSSSGNAYAALVASSGTLTQLSGGGLPANGTINSVAINIGGAGLIGGQDLTNPAYAALVAPDGTLTQLSGGGFPSVNGEIVSVAINSAGVGLIGGQDFAAGAAYAALVAPDGTLTQLSGGGFPSVNGEIRSVAINSAGVGLIGGQDVSAAVPYAALVAPDGTLTQLSGGGLPTTNGIIFSVALSDPESILDGVTPQSIGPYFSVINTQLAAIYALEAHLNMQKRVIFQESPFDEFALLADAREFPPLECRKWRKPTKWRKPIKCCKERKLAIWAAPFGNYLHEKSSKKIPSYTNEIAGAVVAIDYRFSNFLFGGGLGYAFNYIHYEQHLGHGKIHEEMACLYGSYARKYLWINAFVWGGLYQFHNERHSLSFVTSTADIHGWVLSPHIEVAAPFFLFKCDRYTLEPFVMFDWVNTWQSHFTEKGSSGLNLVMKGQYASLLRSEAGMRFLESFCLTCGQLLLKEKISYVNRTPFHFNNVRTFFVASASTFPIATGSSNVQNLAGIEFNCRFVPWNHRYPYVALDFQGEFSASYQSYFADLEIGKTF